MSKRKKVTSARLSPAREVLERLHQALVAMPAMRLADGGEARINSFCTPEAGGDGHEAFGVGVTLPGGERLEFTIAETGPRSGTGRRATAGWQRVGRYTLTAKRVSSAPSRRRSSRGSDS